MYGVISASIYFSIFIYTAVVSKNQYAKYNRSLQTPNRCQKLKIVQIIIISLLFVLLNVYETNKSTGYGGDRTNYYADFLGRKVDWIGLNTLLSILRYFTDNFHYVLYFTTFICCIIPLLAYRVNTEATPETLMFFFSTYYVYSTFDNLKQCYSSALAVIFFCLLSNKKSARRNIACLLTALLASCFHATGFVLFLLFVYSVAQEYMPKYTVIYILILIIAIILFEPLAIAVAARLAEYIPILSGTIYNYFGEGFDARESINAVFLKGSPIYLLSIWGLAKRKNLVRKVPHYDMYLFMTLLSALLYLYSMRVYWLVRLPIILSYPAAMLFSELCRNSIRHNRYILGTIIAGGNLAILLRSMILAFVNFGGI